MAIKTFSVGEVLTSTDTNTYLANSGLVLITSGITVSSAGGSAATVSNGTVTVGTGNTSVTVSGAFSATYDNYRIIYSGGTKSVDGAIALKLSGNDTGYYLSFMYGSYTGTAVTNYGLNNGANWSDAGGGYSGASLLDVDLFSPFLTLATNGTARVRYSTYWGTASLLNTNATSSSGFTLSVSAGTMDSGKIRVYGYRQA